MPGPFFSVVAPTYNCADFMVEAMESVLAQNRDDLEIIVVDDGSTDDTRERLAAYSDRARIIRQDNAGAAVARNRGIEEAQGEWVAFIDSDDRWLRGHLDALERAIGSDPEAVMFFTDSWVIDEAGRKKKEKFSQEMGDSPFLTLLMNNTVSTPGVAVRREVLAEEGGFYSGLRSGQDWDLWLRLAYRHKVVHVPEITIECRRRESSTMHTRGVSLTMREDNMLIMDRVEAMAPEASAAVMRRARARCWADSAGRMLVAGNAGLARQELYGAIRQDPLLGKAWLLLAVAMGGPWAARAAVSLSRRKETKY